MLSMFSKVILSMNIAAPGRGFTSTARALDDHELTLEVVEVMEDPSRISSMRSMFSKVIFSLNTAAPARGFTSTARALDDHEFTLEVVEVMKDPRGFPSCAPCSPR